MAYPLRPTDLRPAPPHVALPADTLRWTCPLETIPAETTEGVEPVEGIIGQERAIKALQMGVELVGPGYNVFVCGLSGTGKATTIQTILEKIQLPCTPPEDLCYVHNFRDEDRPTLLRFPAGQGARFRDELAEAIGVLRQRIPRALEEDEYLKKRQSIIDEYGRREAETFEAFSQTIAPDGFVLGRVQEGQVVHPEILVKIEDKAVMIGDLGEAVQAGTITEEQAEALVEKYRAHREVLQGLFRAGLQLSREYQKLVADHEKMFVSVMVQLVFTEMFELFPDAKVAEYLALLIDHVLANLDLFRERGQGEDEPDLTMYEVNLVIDNEGVDGCPVIIETAPSYTNLFGTIERQQDTQGFWFTDFTRIKAGSILRAQGGFLVLNAADVLSEPGVWRALQRVLIYRKLDIQALDLITQQTASAIKPESIDLNLKVILIGNNEIYGLLMAYERDFKKIFKVKADFDYEMPNTELAVHQYAALIRKLVSDEGLKHFDNTAIAAVVEYGARRSDSKDKLTTQFSVIADIVREAHYWCRKNSNRYVMAEHVHKAIDEMRERHGLFEDKMQEMIDREVMLIDVEGERVGQINGLAVYGGDRFDFGKPSRITAAVGAGEAGIINIEREAHMSGSTHDKGVLILTGYMRETFAQRQPLALSASLSFEQSYSGIDGDSASSTEIYALLSALSGIPIRQQYAVTGSVNQKGDIQPIGGVNEKIEGFFDVCRKRGLTGMQGVLIPVQNVADLMLRTDVVDAVRAGRFRIYAVRRIEEGIEILTGVEAGSRDEEGNFEAGTVFGLAAARLKELLAVSRKRRAKK
ncbi:MAG: AAA family ATPase [Ignavibacteriae bacterium]|nr:AAA family ATPase [Ignavibacteriota bacterium]